MIHQRAKSTNPVLRAAGYFTSLAALLSLTAAAQAEEAARKTDMSSFVRVNRDAKKQPASLETAITRYMPSGEKNEGVSIDLVSAIHVGDRDYYEKLNEQFKDYDVVLYELVAPKKHEIRKGGKSTSAVGMLQNVMKDGLGLEHQLSAVDYKAGNFVHADVTPKEFTESMKKRGESFFSMYFKMLGSSVAQQMSGKGPSDVELLAAVFSNDRTLAFKRLFAEALVTDGSAAVLDGPKGSTILTVRNQAALKVLDAQLKAGKKNIAIFYGAAHMPDFERRLKADYGMKRGTTQWVRAWNMEKKQ
ncbi:MAG: hypothetical protein MI757_21340 [Pirellulales bacterium]|nr:hypothetical protein [Pirellulales bacterium]